MFLEASAGTSLSAISGRSGTKESGRPGCVRAWPNMIKRGLNRHCFKLESCLFQWPIDLYLDHLRSKMRWYQIAWNPLHPSIYIIYPMLASWWPPFPPFLIFPWQEAFLAALFETTVLRLWRLVVPEVEAMKRTKRIGLVNVIVSSVSDLFWGLGVFF